MKPSEPPLKVGIIGVGKHARQVLIPAIEQIPETMRLTALATAHTETAEAAGEFYRRPCHVGHERLIADPNVDAVINAAAGDHEVIAIAGLEAGKSVFNETPGIHTEEGAARIRKLTARKKLTYLTGSCLRYAPVYRKMRSLLEQWREEDPGPRTLNASYYFAGGHLQNLMLYLGGRIDSVLHLAASEGSGTLTLIRFAGGDIGCIRDCGFNNWTPPYEQVEIVHKSGWLQAEDGRGIRFHRTPGTRTAHPMELSFDHASGELYQTTFSIPYGQNHQLYLRGYVPELIEFAHCVRTGTPPTCGVDDALATLRVGNAVRQSRDAGAEWVQVESD